MDVRDLAEPALQELLGANAVFPTQFWVKDFDSTNLTGERALMWAVFSDGIESYRRNADASTPQRRVEFLEAESWILRNDRRWPFSFVNLCDVFGFNADGVRDALIRWRNSQARQSFRRQRFRPAALRAA